MNNHGLTKENLLATLPQALQQDPSVSALADAIADVLAKRPAEIDRLRIYPAIDQLDERLLDILAQDFKVDWWDPDYSLEEKRQTLRDHWRVHKTLGTKAAVVTAISAIYKSATLEEWFQYGGAPYHFRLTIDLTGDRADRERMQRVLDRLEFYKSLRSRLDRVAYVTQAGPLPFVTEERFVFLRVSFAYHLRSYGGTFILLDGKRQLDGSWKLGQAASGARMIRIDYRVRLLEKGALWPGTWGCVTAVQTAQRAALPSLGIRPASPWQTGEALSVPKLQVQSAWRERQAFGAGVSWNGGRSRNQQRLEQPSTRVAGTFQTPEALSAPRIHIETTFQTKEHFSGTLTRDQTWSFDGTYHWDGTKQFNAGITKEDL